MKQEQVIELAKKAGFPVRKGEIGTPRLEHLPINEFVEKLASLVEQATLERAAKRCETKARLLGNLDSEGAHDRAVAARELSTDIRNLAKDAQ